MTMTIIVPLISISATIIFACVGCPKVDGRNLPTNTTVSSLSDVSDGSYKEGSFLRQPLHLQDKERTTLGEGSWDRTKDVRSLNDRRNSKPKAWYNIKSDGVENIQDESTTCQGEVFQGCGSKNHMRPVACYPRDSTWHTNRPSCGKDMNEHNVCARNVHLAPGSNMATSVTISYTIDHSCGSPEPIYNDDEDIYIMIGTNPNELQRVKKVNRHVKQYNATSCLAENPLDCVKETKHFCTSKHFGLYVSDWHVHDAIESGLRPSTTYYFAISIPTCPSLYTPVLSGDDHVTSFFNDDKRILKFTTAPDQSNSDTAISIAVLGDTEHTPDADITFQNVYKSSLKEPFTAMLISGDLAYAYRDHRTWDRWLGVYEPLFSSTPFLITPGNHDQDADCCDWTNFKAYENRFHMPRIRPPQITPACQELASGPDYNLGTYHYGNAYYSVVVGPVHIIVLNTYTGIGHHDHQQGWLKSEISKVNRQKTPWLFVMAHANIYETFKKHKDEDPQVLMKKNFESLFAQYKVNLFISGHDHAYARTRPVYKGKVKDFGTSYITIGNAGAELQTDGLTHNEPWVASWDFKNFGHGVIHIHNKTHAEWETFFHPPGSSKRVQNSDRAMIENSLYKESGRDSAFYAH